MWGLIFSKKYTQILNVLNLYVRVQRKIEKMTIIMCALLKIIY